MRISDGISDVCSSDLKAAPPQSATGIARQQIIARQMRLAATIACIAKTVAARRPMTGRSEDRRVGKECVSTGRSGWSTYQSKKQKMITRRLQYKRHDPYITVQDRQKKKHNSIA